jgi:hypothetical protein
MRGTKELGTLKIERTFNLYNNNILDQWWASTEEGGYTSTFRTLEELLDSLKEPDDSYSFGNPLAVGRVLEGLD